MKLGLLLVGATVGLAGCATSPSCPPSGCTLGCTGRPSLAASPMVAIADHDATPPGNEQQFTVTEGVTFDSPSGQICTVPTPAPVVVHPQWANPDPFDISVSSANDDTNGVAVCTGSTNGPVTLTGTVTTPAGQAGMAEQLTVSVQLTCK